MEEFEKLVAESFQSDLYPAEASGGPAAEASGEQAPVAEAAPETSEQSPAPSASDVNEISDQPVEAPAGRTEE